MNKKNVSLKTDFIDFVSKLTFKPYAKPTKVKSYKTKSYNYPDLRALALPPKDM